MSLAALRTRQSSWRVPGALLWCLMALVQTTLAQDAPALRARHAALQSSLESNAFNRPIHIESVHNADTLRGEVYAVVQQPFSLAGPALQGMEHWCDILMLHLDVKMCLWTHAGSETLTVATARKYDQPLENAAAVEFGYRVLSTSADYLQVQLHADKGPMGTHDYHIVLEAMPLDAKTSFVHLSYAYSQGFGGRIAMEAYLATLGRNKVGFTVVSRRPDGQPVYINNVRGLVERNCMRYFLAIEAYLSAVPLPPGEQLERRLHDWHAGAERYPVQLHEMEREDYLSMKRKEIERQQTAAKGVKPG